MKALARLQEERLCFRVPSLKSTPGSHVPRRRAVWRHIFSPYCLPVSMPVPLGPLSLIRSSKGGVFFPRCIPHSFPVVSLMQALISLCPSNGPKTESQPQFPSMGLELHFTFICNINFCCLQKWCQKELIIHGPSQYPVTTADNSGTFSKSPLFMHQCEQVLIKTQSHSLVSHVSSPTNSLLCSQAYGLKHLSYTFKGCISLMARCSPLTLINFVWWSIYWLLFWPSWNSESYILRMINSPLLVLHLRKAFVV